MLLQRGQYCAGAQVISKHDNPPSLRPSRNRRREQRARGIVFSWTPDFVQDAIHDRGCTRIEIEDPFHGRVQVIPG